MDSYNEEVADLCEDLHDAGVGASPFVASLHTAADSFPADAMGNYRGVSTPNWADRPSAGSGPSPKRYISDSQSWLDANEKKDMRNVLAEPPDADTPIVKFNDGRSKPPQGPRHGSRRQALSDTFGDLGGSIYPNPTISQGKAGHPPHSAPAGGQGYGFTGAEPLKRTVTTRRHYAEGDPSGGGESGSGFFNPENPDEEDWEAGSGKEFVDQLSDSANQVSNSLPTGGGGGGGAGAGEAGGEAATAEELAPLALAASRQAAFSVEAFDRGEFAPVGWDSGGGVAQYGGELRRTSRAGRGPTQQIRVDPGMRRGAPNQSHETYASIMNDRFGNMGELPMTEYGEPAADPMGSDIVANFHRSGAAQAIYQQAPGGTDDFASSPYVQGFLRTAGRKFSLEEQRELEEEEHHLGARNLPTDQDLAGTHYLLGL
jgi:hypothetical protein